MNAPLQRSIPRLAALFLLLVLATVTTIPTASAVEPDAPPITDAIEWLRTQQSADGSFSPGGEGDPGTTADVVFALAAAGVDPTTFTSDDGSSPIDYLIANVDGTITDPGLASKSALALHAAGTDPRDVDGTDLIAAITGGYDAETGFYGQGAGPHGYALLALAAAGENPDPAALEAILAAQIEDGSWGFTGETTPGTGDSNTTALVIQALVAHNAGETAVENGIDYLHTLQDENGAVAYDASEASDLAGDANSTALTIQAFIAAGEDPTEMQAALESFQNPGGAFFWRTDFADDSLLATVQAIPALLDVALPIGQSGTKEAGIVVRLGDDSLIYRTVEFEEPSIDGTELLTRSELDVSMAPFGGLGAAVCSIEGEGCPSDDCFCQSYSNPAFFWHYYVLEDGEWVEYPAGASTRTLSDGDIDGWSWTADEHGLPAVTLEEIAASSALPAPGETEDDNSNSTYLVFAGMAVLVLLIGGFGVMRSRAKPA